MLKAGLDLLMRPLIERFAFRQALRMERAELLSGARIAALRVTEALGSAMHGDGEPLASLAEGGALQPQVFDALREEARRGREDVDGEALTAMLGALAAQQCQIEQQCRLRGVSLVVGACRAASGASSTRRWYQMNIGSHLTVVDDEPAGLWRQERQQHLLFARGATVHAEVEFDAHEPSERAPQRYVFEAYVSGARLQASQTVRNATSGQEARDAGEEDGLQFSIASLNGLAEPRFWAHAEDVGYGM